MYNHAPEGESCVFCRIVRGAREEHPAGVFFQDVLIQTPTATAFLALDRWERNPVDVLVVPNEHIENLYDFPSRLAPAVHELTRLSALALKAVYACGGVSTRQHNEPAGGQDVWHYHVHVTPRFAGDDFYRASRRVPFPPQEYTAETLRLREWMRAHARGLLDESSAVKLI